VVTATKNDNTEPGCFSGRADARLFVLDLWRRATEQHRWVRNEAMCALLSDYREWFGFRKPAR
jgi:hypothetical protein